MHTIGTLGRTRNKNVRQFDLEAVIVIPTILSKVFQ